jgi:hypothetical protein
MDKKKNVIGVVFLLCFILFPWGKSHGEEKSSPVIIGDESAFVGIWLPETGGKAPRGLPDDLRLLKDGTGIIEGMSITWQFDKNRIVFTRSGTVFAYDYSVSMSTLTLTDGKGQSKKYIKVHDGSNPYWPDDPNWKDDISENPLIYNDPSGMLRMLDQFTDQEPVNIKSQLEMAEIHERLGNFGFSVKYYKRAANLGDAGAQNKLGEMYRKGLGVHKDEKKAVDWFTKAANQGNIDAQKNLGR